MFARSSKSKSRPSSRTPRVVANSLGYDFALLGLRAREARVEVIRRAARNTAARINEASLGATEHDSMLSELATSTYRLLDPRRRSRGIERVQLCILSEEDLEQQRHSRTAMLQPSTRSLQGVGQGGVATRSSDALAQSS